MRPATLFAHALMWLFLLLGSGCLERTRSWTTLDGRGFEATLVDVDAEAGFAELKLTDQSRLSMPFEELGEADRAYLLAWWKKKAQRKQRVESWQQSKAEWLERPKAHLGSQHHRLPPTLQNNWPGFTLLAGGGLVILVSLIAILKRAFLGSRLLGWLSLLLPPAYLIIAVKNWKFTGVPLICQVFGAVMLIAGALLLPPG